VSKLCQALDERVDDFLNRPLEGAWPYLWLEATYLKVRQRGRVISVATIIATGVNPEGKREILGLGIGLSEAKAFWVEFLRSLVARCLSGVQRVISDRHVGLKAAIAQVLSATWQRCRVQMTGDFLSPRPPGRFQRSQSAPCGLVTRNLLACVPRDCAGMVAALLRPVFSQPDWVSARTHWRQVADQLRSKFPKAAALMEGRD